MQPQSNQFFGIKVSKPNVNVNQANDKDLVFKNDFSTQTFYDDTNPRILLGKLPNNDYGMYVSKPGYDVTTATDNQLIFNSNQDILKVVTSGVTKIDHPANTESWPSDLVDVGKPGIYAVLAYTAFDLYNDGTFADMSSIPYTKIETNGTNAGKVLVQITMTTIDQYVVFDLFAANLPLNGYYTDAYTIYIRYWILQETAN
jgi:hypothetical protein